MKRIFLTFILLSTYLLADSSVWRVQKGDDVLYIGGTVHMLKKSDYPLPKEYDRAFEDAHRLYFETNLQDTNKPSFQKALVSKMLLKDGKKLSTTLSKETYKKLQKYARFYSINLRDYEKFKVSAIIVTLTMAEFQRIGVNALGVDKYYELKGLNSGKSFGELESIDEHLNFLASIGEGNEDKLVDKSLDEFKKLRAFVDEMTEAWRSGDEEKLYNLFSKDMKIEYPKIYDSIIVQRNNNWLPKIKAMFGNSEREFVLVGVGHLLGEEGLIEQLKKDGFRVEKF